MDSVVRVSPPQPRSRLKPEVRKRKTPSRGLRSASHSWPYACAGGPRPPVPPLLGGRSFTIGPFYATPELLIGFAAAAMIALALWPAITVPVRDGRAVCSAYSKHVHCSAEGSLMNLAMFIVNVLSCIAWATVAFAQGDPPYPSRTVRLVVATTAGTTADVLARVLADRTSVLWRQSVVVENRPGVAGITSVASASPDGHALLVTANGHAAVGALHKDLPLDPVKDLVGAPRLDMCHLFWWFRSNSRCRTCAT